MVIPGVALSDLLLPLLLAGLTVRMGRSDGDRGYIPKALKMVAEPYHSAAKPTRTAGIAS